MSSMEGTSSKSSVEFVRDLVNRGVMNDQGEGLGKIRAISVNLESGNIAYAVLAFGVFPNRTKLFAVPWELLRFSTHDRKFILNVPKKTLELGLGYDTIEQIVHGANFYWLGDVYEYYSDKPDWEAKRQEQMQRDIKAAELRREQIMGPLK